MQNFTDAVYEAIGAPPIDNHDDVVARIRNLVDAVTQHPHEIAQLAALKDRETDMAIERHTQNMRVLAEKLRVSTTRDAIMRRVTQLTQIEAQLCAEFDIDAQLTPEAVAFGIAQLRASAGDAQAAKSALCAVLGLDASRVTMQEIINVVARLKEVEDQLAQELEIRTPLTAEAVWFGMLMREAGEAQALAQVRATFGLSADTGAQDVAQHAQGIIQKSRDLMQETARQAQQLARIDQELRKARNDCAAAEHLLARYRGGAQ